MSIKIKNALIFFDFYVILKCIEKIIIYKFSKGFYYGKNEGWRRRRYGYGRSAFLNAS